MESARLCGKNESSIREVKNKEKIHASFSVAPQTCKNYCWSAWWSFDEVEQALKFWVEDMNIKKASLFIITLFNVGNVLLCVIYQLNFAVFMYVTHISRYIRCT
jgi:hypothetical protein